MVHVAAWNTLVTIRRNTLVSLAGQGASLVISLVTVPIFLRLIGEERYGVLLIVWLLLGYFGLFDLGLGQATAQRVAMLKQAPASERSAVVWTSLALNACLGALAALVLYVSAHLVLGYVITTGDALRHEAMRALPWIALALPVSMSASTLSAALIGRERFVATNVIQTLGTLLAQGLPLFVAWRLTSSLDRLIEAALLARLVSAVALLFLCRDRVPLSWPPRVEARLVRPLLSFGGWITVSGVIGPLMTNLDRVLIGAIAGTSAITYYSVPQGLCARLGMIPSSLATALSPRLAAAEPIVREELADRAVRALACILTPLTLLGLMIIDPFLGLWLSRDFAAKASMSGQILLVGIWANGLAQVAHTNLVAQGRPSAVARAHLVELPCYIALLAAALHPLGIVGASGAWSVRAIADAALLFGGCGSLRRVTALLTWPIVLLTLALAACVSDPALHGFHGLLLAVLVMLSLLWARQNAPPQVFNIRTAFG